MSSASPNPGPLWKVIFLWIVVFGLILAGVALFFIINVNHRSAGKPVPTAAPAWFQNMALISVGAFVAFAGVTAYLLFVQTNGLTFNFRRPVWQSAKLKIYLAKVVSEVLLVLGGGAMASGLLGPLIERFGVARPLSLLIPFGAFMLVLQVTMVWVNVWTPVTIRLITRRLLAKGILPQQLQLGIPIGISDPTKSDLKKLILEDDVGMFWIDTGRLVYFGDQEHFSITPQAVAAAERKLQMNSLVALSGASHLILRVRQPDGHERQIRLHTETAWTMGRKRAKMDALAARIDAWLAAGTNNP
jgi:hypothetical protein